MESHCLPHLLKKFTFHLTPFQDALILVTLDLQQCRVTHLKRVPLGQSSFCLLLSNSLPSLTFLIPLTLWQLLVGMAAQYWSFLCSCWPCDSGDLDLLPVYHCTLEMPNLPDRQGTPMLHLWILSFTRSPASSKWQH